MVSEAELLEAIRADPADDGARLVYGDWLLERGDVRGEIVQLQLRYPRRKAQLAKAIAKLPRPAWAGAWPPAFERGFATKVIVSDGDVLVRELAAIRAAHPFAAIELAQPRPLATSGDLIATILVEQDGAGNQATGASWTTTTAVVLDGSGRRVFEETRTYTESYSGSGDHEDGETIVGLAFVAPRELELRISDGTSVRRTF